MRLLENKVISIRYSVSLDFFILPHASWVGDEHSLLFTALGKVLLGQLLTYRGKVVKKTLMAQVGHFLLKYEKRTYCGL